MKEKLGLVFRSTGSWYEIRDKSGDFYNCRLKGKFKIKDLKVTNPIAVGDQVKFFLEEGSDNQGIIFDILPRKNYIVRNSVHKAHHAHLLASNLDLLVLIFTLHSPRTSLGFLDRFLVTAETFRIPAVIIFNKIDIYDKNEKEIVDALIHLYENLGYKCIKTSIPKKKGIKDVKELLSNKISLVSGHSGVGKSTLLNILDPELDLATNEISDFANKGVHTTTFAEMFEFPNKTYIIDSPGIKELGLYQIEDVELGHYFPEFRKKMSECKFNNCKHVNEPKCAIKDAISTGEISEARYMSYLSMLENDDNRR